MIQTTEPDPSKAAFRFSDLPGIAQDARAHGIDELVLWNWSGFGHLPIRMRHELGTAEELAGAIRAAKALGVNITGFVNVKNLNDSYASRYGVRPGSSASWTYHPELIPAMFPFSAPSGQIDIETTNKIWQRDVIDALTEWIDRGLCSFAWDVFQDHGSMDLVNLVKQVRKIARARDPESTFAGEPAGSNLERCAQALDYTWNWTDYIEAGPYLNAIRYPRFNCNVEKSARVVKMAFADGLYINAMPKRPNQPNSTKRIGEEPELAAALKQVAPLRRRFLPYFVDGLFIGESVLSRPVCRFVRRYQGSWIGGATVPVGDFEYPPVFVRGHQLPKSLLIVVLNNEERPRDVVLESRLDLWLPRSAAYRVKYYDQDCREVRSDEWKGGSAWSGRTDVLQPLELAFFEIRSD